MYFYKQISVSLNLLLNDLSNFKVYRRKNIHFFDVLFFQFAVIIDQPNAFFQTKYSFF